MRPRESPTKQAQSRREAQPGLGPGEACNNKWAYFEASPVGPATPHRIRDEGEGHRRQPALYLRKVTRDLGTTARFHRWSAATHRCGW